MRTVAILAAGIVLGMTVAARSHATAAPAGSIVGVWSFVSETDTETGKPLNDEKTIEALWVFTNHYYVVARMQKGRTSMPAGELAKLPPTEQVKYFQQLQRYASTAGEYTASNGLLRRKWQISNSPGIIGQEQVAKYSVDGDRLTVDTPRRSADSGPAIRLVYRRLE
jgi:Lipocalin-like domain